MTRRRTRVPAQTRINAAFAQIAEVLEHEEHNDASLFGMISGLIPHNAVLATVLASNIAVILDGTGEEVNYTDVLVEAYRISLFERIEGAQFYDAFEGDPAEAEQFAINFKHMASGGNHLMLVANTSNLAH